MPRSRTVAGSRQDHPQTELLSPTPSTKTQRLRLSPPIPSEAEFAEAVAQFLRAMVLKPAEWTCFPAGVVPLPAAAATKLVRFGLQRGWPDYLILYAGVLHGLELKRPGGRLSKSYLARTAKGGVAYRVGQEEVFPRLRAAGMQLAVCFDLGDVIKALQDWGIPMRRHT